MKHSGLSKRLKSVGEIVIGVTVLSVVLGLLGLGLATITVSIWWVVQTPPAEWEMALLIFLGGWLAAAGFIWGAYRIVVRK